MGNKKIYEKPSVISLNGLSASGMRPMGMCETGTSVHIASCASGTGPINSDDKSCSPTGNWPTYGYCTLGNSAIEGCTSGGNHA
jgi:hypothetical protein